MPKQAQTAEKIFASTNRVTSQRPMTGQEYIESIRDGRSSFIGFEMVNSRFILAVAIHLRTQPRLTPIWKLERQLGSCC